jgi:DNA repair photolyase
MTVTDFREVQAKTILVKSGISGTDFCLNPYTGCGFGCIYCYACFIGRFIGGKSFEDWGSYVFAKVNAAELLSGQLKKLKYKGRDREVFVSSVTDPYQGAEAKYRLTRKCLEIFAEAGFEGAIYILTKSDLVTRDIDILKRLKRIRVGLTVTSSDDIVSRYFERFAPPVSERFKALKKLNEEGIITYAFVGPLLPSFVADKTKLETVFKKLADVGTRDLFVEHINLSSYIRNRMFKEMKGVDKEIMRKFYLSQTDEYRAELDNIVKELVEKYKMRLLTGTTIFHKESQKTEGITDPYEKA